jgi:hypothetical protein
MLQSRKEKKQRTTIVHRLGNQGASCPGRTASASTGTSDCDPVISNLALQFLVGTTQLEAVSKPAVRFSRLLGLCQPLVTAGSEEYRKHSTLEESNLRLGQNLVRGC